MSDRQHTTWEYRVERDISADELNKLGEVGWELVTVEGLDFYLKRPRLSFRERVTLDQKRRYYALWNVAAGDEEAGR